MALIFISHSSRDAQQAKLLNEWLESIGSERSFLDFDKHSGIPPGAYWERKLYNELQRCHAVLLVLTKNWFDSNWCFAEFAQARAMGKAIFPIIEHPIEEARRLPSDIQRLDLTSDRNEGLEQLRREIVKLAFDVQGGFDWPAHRAPFPGLLSFDAEDAAVFFGRDDDARRVVERINARRIQGGEKMITILGGSGSGKSSLLKAGILPRLTRDKKSFLVTPPFRPGQDPVRGLLEALRAIDISITRADLEEIKLAPSAARFIDRLRRAAKAPQATLILSVDQAEELFTRSAVALRRQFFQILSELLYDDNPALSVLTLRADHLADLQSADREGLRPAFEECSLKPIPVGRLHLIIEGPARVAGLKVEAELVQSLTHDAAAQDALPLVAFVLRRLFDRYGSAGGLTLAQYEAMRESALSPLEVAVRDAANELLERAKPDEAELAALREAFVPALVRINDDDEFVAQSAIFTDLPQKSQRLLRMLVDARLLVMNTHDGVSRIEVAHESLFRVWPQLSNWLEAEREFLIGKSQIGRAHVDYLAVPESERPGALLSGILLQRARRWLQGREGWRRGVGRN